MQLNANYLITIQKNNGIACKLQLEPEPKQMILICDADHCYKITEMNVKFPSDLFESKTVFDCVLVGGILYIYDIFKPELIFLDRLCYIHHLLRKKAKKCTEKKLQVRLAGYFPYNHIPLLTKSCTLIFKLNSHCPNDMFAYHYCCATVEVPPLNGTIMNFLIQKTPQRDVYKIHPTSQILGITSSQMSTQMMRWFATHQERMMQCRYEIYFHCWLPVI